MFRFLNSGDVSEQQSGHVLQMSKRVFILLCTIGVAAAAELQLFVCLRTCERDVGLSRRGEQPSFLFQYPFIEHKKGLPCA